MVFFTQMTFSGPVEQKNCFVLMEDGPMDPEWRCIYCLSNMGEAIKGYSIASYLRLLGFRVTLQQK